MSSYFQFLGHVIETSRVAALARMSAPVIEVSADDSKKQLVGDKIKVKMISKVLLKKITQRA